MNYIEEIKAYRPTTLQEAADKQRMLAYIEMYPDTILDRENDMVHLTASSLIFNPRMDRLLMVYHNIYRSWSWSGGHADGEPDGLATALKEAVEETGVRQIHPLDEGLASLDILPVCGHMKRGRYVCAHLHLNLSYFLTADDDQPLRIKPDENSRVGWIRTAELRMLVTEPHMIPVYEKLIKKIEFIEKR